MAEKIYFTSFKGGVGVTTCAVGTGIALSRRGERTLIADGDARCACALDIAGVSPLKVYTLGDAEKGACRPKQAIIQHPEYTNLYFLPTQGAERSDTADLAVDELEGLFDYVLCDRTAMMSCDRAVAVTDPYPPSVRSADACLAFLKDRGFRNVQLVVNKVNGGLVFDGEIMTPQEIASLLHAPLLAVVAEDLTLPLGKCKKRSEKAFRLAAQSLCGEGDRVMGVVRPYRGFHGFVRRKMRNKI